MGGTDSKWYKAKFTLFLLIWQAELDRELGIISKTEADFKQELPLDPCLPFILFLPLPLACLKVLNTQGNDRKLDGVAEP